MTDAAAESPDADADARARPLPPPAPGGAAGTEAPRRDRGVGGAFRDGAAISFSFMLVGAPFGMLFGAVATEAGLNIAETMALSIVVMAGAAQFALVELLADGAPALIALMAAFAVNLRMLMYSASIAPHLAEAPLRARVWMAYFLVDQVYAASIDRFTRRPGLPLSEKTAFWLGVGGPMFVVWYGATYLGAVAGGRIPEGWSLDFAPAITFIAITAPMLRSIPALIAAGVAIAAALGLAWLPWSLGLPFAAFAGMIAGAGTEVALARRAARRAPSARRRAA